MTITDRLTVTYLSEMRSRTFKLALTVRSVCGSTTAAMWGDTSATFNDTAKTVIRPSSDNWTIHHVVHSFHATQMGHQRQAPRWGVLGLKDGTSIYSTGDTALKYYATGDAIHPFNATTLENVTMLLMVLLVSASMTSCYQRHNPNI